MIDAVEVLSGKLTPLSQVMESSWLMVTKLQTKDGPPEIIPVSVPCGFLNPEALLFLHRTAHFD